MRIQNLEFPLVISYDMSNNRVWNPKVNALFGLISILEKEKSNIKNGEPIPMNQFSVIVTPAGFKPATLRAEIWYSIQLNYGAFINVLFH